MTYFFYRNRFELIKVNALKYYSIYTVSKSLIFKFCISILRRVWICISIYFTLDFSRLLEQTQMFRGSMVSIFYWVRINSKSNLLVQYSTFCYYFSIVYLELIQWIFLNIFKFSHSPKLRIFFFHEPISIYILEIKLYTLNPCMAKTFKII